MEEDEKVALFAISIDTPDKSNIMTERVAKDGKGEIKFPILSDPMHKTIDDYGLLDTRYIGRGIEGVPQTAIYILGEDRKIVWANVSEDYVNRPTVADLRTEINKLKKMSGKEMMDKKEKMMDKKEQMEKPASKKMMEKEKMEKKDPQDKSD